MRGPPDSPTDRHLDVLRTLAVPDAVLRRHHDVAPDGSLRAAIDGDRDDPTQDLLASMAGTGRLLDLRDGIAADDGDRLTAALAPFGFICECASAGDDVEVVAYDAVGGDIERVRIAADAAGGSGGDAAGGRDALASTLLGPAGIELVELLDGRHLVADRTQLATLRHRYGQRIQPFDTPLLTPEAAEALPEPAPERTTDPAVPEGAAGSTAAPADRPTSAAGTSPDGEADAASGDAGTGPSRQTADEEGAAADVDDGEPTDDSFGEALAAADEGTTRSIEEALSRSGPRTHTLEDTEASLDADASATVGGGPRRTVSTKGIDEVFDQLEASAEAQAAIRSGVAAGDDREAVDREGEDQADGEEPIDDTADEPTGESAVESTADSADEPTGASAGGSTADSTQESPAERQPATTTTDDAGARGDRTDSVADAGESPAAGDPVAGGDAGTEASSNGGDAGALGGGAKRTVSGTSADDIIARATGPRDFDEIAAAEAGADPDSVLDAAESVPTELEEEPEDAEAVVPDVQAKPADARAGTAEAEAEPADAEVEKPDAEAEPADAEAETGEAEAETTDAEAEAPDAEVETPDVEAESPEAEAETADTEAEAPDAEAETADVDAESPEAEAETAVGDAETPAEGREAAGEDAGGVADSIEAPEPDAGAGPADEHVTDRSEGDRDPTDDSGASARETAPPSDLGDGLLDDDVELRRGDESVAEPPSGSIDGVPIEDAEPDRADGPLAGGDVGPAAADRPSSDETSAGGADAGDGGGTSAGAGSDGTLDDGDREEDDGDERSGLLGRITSLFGR